MLKIKVILYLCLLLFKKKMEQEDFNIRKCAPSVKL